MLQKPKPTQQEQNPTLSAEVEISLALQEPNRTMQEPNPTLQDHGYARQVQCMLLCQTHSPHLVKGLTRTAR